MRLPIWLTALTALLTAGAALVVAWFMLRPSGRVIDFAEFSPATLSPNADGVDDVTRITYRLDRPAIVSIYFLDSSGRRFDFRKQKPRDSGEHTLLFSGVVDGFLNAGEQIEGQVLARVLPDGVYTWVIEAAPRNGALERTTGALEVKDAEAALPELRGFSASPAVFSPNQDGIDDRATINVYLSKPILPDGLHVTLVGADGSAYPIAEKEGEIRFGEEGLHPFDYDGGIDLGANPPPDGTYTVVGLAEDRVGQKVEVRTTLTIAAGGLPRADIVNASVDFSATTLVLGETLYFTLTVENYGSAPIRTTGPAPGTIYPMEANANTLGWYEESGAWRVGIDCDTCLRDYPWRWAVAPGDGLTRIGEYDYLLPGRRATVTGGIRLTQLPDRNPLYFWAGLIHEDVEISPVNNRVDPHFITILPAR